MSWRRVEGEHRETWALYCEDVLLGCVRKFIGEWLIDGNRACGFRHRDGAKGFVEARFDMHMRAPTGELVCVRADLSRICSKCRKLPRWSAYKACRHCKVCGNPRKHVARRRNSYEHVPRAYGGRKDKQ
jgi:hypothetical protein